jgi:hypothetical protein
MEDKMKRLSCRGVKNSLSAYLDGELASDCNILIEKHLQGCSSCQTFFSELKSLREALNSLGQALTSREPPILIPERVVSRLPKYDFGLLTDPVIRRAAIGIGVVLLLFTGALKLNQTLRFIPPSFALVVQVQGEAERYSKDNQWQPVGLHYALHPNELIKTEVGSNMKIQLQDGSTLFVREDSLLEIKRLAPEPEFSLEQGGLLAFVAKSSSERKFLIHTPLVEIQALGTLFKVYVNERSTEVEVLEGEVEVKAKVEVNKQVGLVLRQFERTVISGQIQQPFSPKRMLPQEIEVLRKEFREARLLEEKKPLTRKRSIIFWREIK